MFDVLFSKYEPRGGLLETTKTHTLSMKSVQKTFDHIPKMGPSDLVMLLAFGLVGLVIRAVSKGMQTKKKKVFFD